MAEKLDNSEIFYVSIGNASPLRKGILEASKKIIECLHRYEKFKRVRAERIRASEELTSLVKELSELASQIKIDLPKVKLPARKKSGKKEKKESIEEPDKSDDELHKLEAAIKQIESRLGSMK